MAYYIGQKRKEDYNNGFSNSAGEMLLKREVTTINPFKSLVQNDFQDVSIVKNGGSFQKGQVYFLTVTLVSSSGSYTDYGSQIDFKVFLKNRSGSENKYTYETVSELGSDFLSVFPGENNQINVEKSQKTFYYIFVPDRNSNAITIEIQRNLLDIENGPRSFSIGTNGLTLSSLTELKTDGGYWNKIGFQSKPGTLIVVNKQPIRVGRSGVYQLDNKTKITSFMIAPISGNTVNSFLLDYAYQDQE